MPNEPLRCSHRHTNHRPCGSPALRGQTLCRHHHPSAGPARTPRVPLAPPVLPDPADLPAVQRGLAELLRLTAGGLIDDKQAKRLLALLAEAGKNLARLDRQSARARTLDLRERALALAEVRFAAHPARHAPPPAAADPDPAATPARRREIEAALEAEARAAHQRRLEQERQHEHDRRLAEREATRARLTPELRLRYDAARAAEAPAREAVQSTHPPLTPMEC